MWEGERPYKKTRGWVLWHFPVHIKDFTHVRSNTSSSRESRVGEIAFAPSSPLWYLSSLFVCGFCCVFLSLSLSSLTKFEYWRFSLLPPPPSPRQCRLKRRFVLSPVCCAPGGVVCAWRKKVEAKVWCTFWGVIFLLFCENGGKGTLRWSLSSFLFSSL